MIRKIIVPLDGSPFGEHALPSALAIARRAGAEVQIVHVNVPAPLLYAGGEIVTDLDLTTPLLEQGKKYLRAVAGRIAKIATVPITQRLLDGPIADALAADIETEKADLVVMCTHGRGPLSRFWLGSVADRLIRESTAPILLVRPQAESPDFCSDAALSRVLVPLDGSELAEQVLETVRGFSQLMGANLLLLRVIQPVVLGNYVATPEGIAVYTEKLVEQLEEMEEQSFREAADYLDGVARHLRADGLAVRTRVVSHDQPSAAILDQARADSADLIALATHGRRGISRLFLGSVADKVLRGTSLPVLLQRPQPLPEGTPARAESANRRSEPAAQPASVAAAAPDAKFNGNPGCLHGQR